MKGGGDPANCASLAGDLNPILAKLDPAFDLVISGHTHQAYVCNYGSVDPARPFLVTSAGQYGTLLTRITLRYDPAARKLIGKRAENIVVTQALENDAAQPEIATLVSRYQAAATSVKDRIVGRLGGPLTDAADDSGQSTLGNFIADAQLAAMAPADKGGAQLAFMNPGGLRAPIHPRSDGAVTFGDLYAAQPFANTLVVKALTGAQIRAVLDERLNRLDIPTILSVSKGVTYAFDRSRPVGQRVFDLRLNGQPIADGTTYRVAMNSFMGQGGDGLALFASAPLLVDGPVDVDALEAYVTNGAGRQPPALDRIRNLSPR
jgi:5'-nucleotidase